MSDQTVSSLLLEIPPSTLVESDVSTQKIETQLSRVDAAIASLHRARRGLQRYRASAAAANGKSGPQDAERRLSVLERLEGLIEAGLRRSARLRRSLLQEEAPAPRAMESTRAVVLPEPVREEARPEPPAAEATPAPPPIVPPEPAAAVPSAAAPPAAPPPEPVPAPRKREFLALSSDEQIDIVWELLLGAGALERREAIRLVTEGLRSHGLANPKGDLSEVIASVLQKGLQEGSFDRGRRGTVRAVLTDPKDYQPEDWQRCLLAVIGPEPAEINETLRAAAEWAQDTMGLEFARLRTGGIILTGLQTALDELVDEEIVQRQGTTVRNA